MEKNKLEIKYTYTMFRFQVNGKDWTIICKNAKHKENIFKVYEDKVHKGDYQPTGNHVNKTTALNVLKSFISKENQ